MNLYLAMAWAGAIVAIAAMVWIIRAPRGLVMVKLFLLLGGVSITLLGAIAPAIGPHIVGEAAMYAGLALVLPLAAFEFFSDVSWRFDQLVAGHESATVWVKTEVLVIAMTFLVIAVLSI